MSSHTKKFPRKQGILILAILLLGLRVSPLLAAQPPTPCKTNGPLQATALSPASYSYIQNALGSTNGNYTVSSPGVQTTGGCDQTMIPVFGNTNSASTDVTIEVTGATNTGDGLDVAPATLSAIRNAFQFVPAEFSLTLTGTGSNPNLPSQLVNYTFTNSSSIPVGMYDINIQASATATGVGPANKTFTLTVTEPPPQPQDTLEPLVEIHSPLPAAVILINGILDVNFTASDPIEGGAGTGVTSMGASVKSTGSAVDEDISGDLSVNPPLPVIAGTTATATAQEMLTAIGSYTLIAQASDGANHTGTASVGFVVKANLATLPPISVPGRVFNTGSTVPIKFTFTDANGNFLSPYQSVLIRILWGNTMIEERVAGDGSNNIRWEVDEYGNATQYITNFQIPYIGTYTVEIYLDDVDANPALQGTFSFTSSTKGGKS